MTADKFYDEFKICPVCLDPFYRPRSCSPASWAGRVTCSHPCRAKYTAALSAGQHLTVPAPTPIRRDPDPGWRDRGACLGVEPELFFPLSNDWKGRADTGKVEQAKAICDRCPSRQACLADAIESKDAWSIRGGLTPQERRPLVKARVAVS